MRLKKIAAFAAVCGLAFGVCSVLPTGESVYAQSSEDDFTIEYKENGKYISGYMGSGGDIVIPADISGISDIAFYGTAVKSVTFEGDIENIGGLAFCGCTSLEKVTFMGDAASADGSGEGGIQFNAFMGCRSLKTVEFDENSHIDAIGRAAFMDCENLTDVKLPKDVGIIGEYAFMNCPELTRLEIPSATELDAFAAGYMFDEETEKEVKADGIASVRASLDFDGMQITDVVQKPITLIVTENSPAEKYAKEYGIAYEYKNETTPADHDAVTAEKNPATGEADKLPAVAAAAAIISVSAIAFGGKKEN